MIRRFSTSTMTTIFIQIPLLYNIRKQPKRDQVIPHYYSSAVTEITAKPPSEAATKCLLCQSARTINQRLVHFRLTQPKKIHETHYVSASLGPTKIQREQLTDLTTMVDHDRPGHRRVRHGTNHNKTTAKVARICEMMWFTRQPLPQRITLARGAEFMAEYARIVTNDYGLTLTPITTRNTQTTAIIERGRTRQNGQERLRPNT
jgi:hypothetical protein